MTQKLSFSAPLDMVPAIAGLRYVQRGRNVQLGPSGGKQRFRFFTWKSPMKPPKRLMQDGGQWLQNGRKSSCIISFSFFFPEGIVLSKIFALLFFVGDGKKSCFQRLRVCCP